MSNGSKSGLAPTRLLSLAEAVLGKVSRSDDISWDHGESQVWLLWGARGQAVLKSHRQPRKFEQELAAYREWLPRLPRQEDGWSLPVLLATREEEPRALVLSRASGSPLGGRHYSADVERGLHRSAGGFLGALHGLPLQDGDPLPLAQALERRAEAWLGRAERLLPLSLRQAVAELAREAASALGESRRVPCHRDFTPRNWLVDRSDPRALTVIDFEHSRGDLALMDLERLWSGTWRERPDLREAFLAGYGRTLSGEEEQLLERLSALAGLGTVVWAREHGDREFEERGREQLRRLGLPL